MTIQHSTKPSIGQRWEAYRPTKTALFWACIVSIIATMVVGFGWGGWGTGASSRSAAEASGKTSYSELATAICVDRFNLAPDAEARRAELGAITGNTQMRTFVEAGGWAMMPGQTTTDRTIATDCATALKV